MRKPAFCICGKTKAQISYVVTVKLISVFVFATYMYMVQCLYLINPKFQTANHLLWLFFFFFFFFFLIQFNVPFKIISLIETSQSVGGRNGSTPGKPPDTPASRTCLVSHVASAGLELLWLCRTWSETPKTGFRFSPWGSAVA